MKLRNLLTQCSFRTNLKITLINQNGTEKMKIFRNILLFYNTGLFTKLKDCKILSVKVKENCMEITILWRE